MKRTDLLLLAFAIILAVLPLLYGKLFLGEAAAFDGADANAERAIHALSPGYKPWAQPLFRPPSNEIASSLFGLQSAIGAALVAYCVGYYRGKRSATEPNASRR